MLGLGCADIWSQQQWDVIDQKKVSKDVKPHGMRVGVLKSIYSPVKSTSLNMEIFELFFIMRNSCREP